MSTDNAVAYGNFTDAFVDQQAEWLGDRRVLEVMAGNGLLASKLAARGVDILATSLFAGHDGHDRGMCWPVEEISAPEAVVVHGGWAEVLLVSWPTTTEAMARTALEWGADRPLVFIGEMPNPDIPGGQWPGCASDFFFEITDVEESFSSYSPASGLDCAVVMRILPQAEAKCSLPTR